MFTRISAVLLLAVLALSGCSGSGSFATNGPVPVDIPDRPLRKIPDSEVVAKAVRRLVDADTGTVAWRLKVAGIDTKPNDGRGAFSISAAQSFMKLRSPTAKGKRESSEYRILGTFVYGRAPRQDCWNAAVVDPSGLPAEVLALLSARGEKKRSREGSAFGTVRLGDTVGGFGPGWTQLVRAEGQAAFDQGLRVRFAIENGRFAGWTWRGKDLVTAMEQAGVTISKPLQRQLNTFTMKVTLEQPGAKLDLEPPTRMC